MNNNDNSEQFKSILKWFKYCPSPLRGNLFWQYVFNIYGSTANLLQRFILQTYSTCKRVKINFLPMIKNTWQNTYYSRMLVHTFNIISALDIPLITTFVKLIKGYNFSKLQNLRNTSMVWNKTSSFHYYF